MTLRLENFVNIVMITITAYGGGRGCSVCRELKNAFEKKKRGWKYMGKTVARELQ
jgi:hypothetical protein